MEQMTDIRGRGIKPLLVALVLAGCGQSETIATLAREEPEDVFTAASLEVPATFDTEALTDHRVVSYCGGFKRAAYYGESGNFNRPFGIFVHKVFPRDDNRCLIYGTFSRQFVDWPRRLYPFRAEFDGLMMYVRTINFHGFGPKVRIEHRLRIDQAGRMQYGARKVDGSGGGNFLEMTLYEVPDALFVDRGIQEDVAGGSGVLQP